MSPRKPDGITARTEHISARFRPATAAQLDELRGPNTRTRFLEYLVMEEYKRQKGTS